MSGDNRRLQPSDLICRLLEFSCRWQHLCENDPQLIAKWPGAGTCEAFVLIELLGDYWDDDILPTLSNAYPQLTAAGQEMRKVIVDTLEFDISAGAYKHLTGRACNWLAVRRSWLPDVNGTVLVDYSDLLWICLCQCSPVCGLYEQPTSAFMAELQAYVGWVGVAQPATVISRLAPPRRRQLY